MTETVSPHSCSLTWDDVRVERQLGSGSFASVYSVKSDSMLDQNRSSFALKCLDPEDSDEEQKEQAACCLLQEASILRQLPRHPNVIKLLAVSDNLNADPNCGFLLFEKVANTLDDLTAKWKAEKSRSWKILTSRINPRSVQQERIRRVAVSLASAMLFLHRHGILYRDLKPGNVGIGFDGKVSLFDFGFARRYDENEDKLLTPEVGTPRYMAAESWTEQYGFPVDVYSYSLILWELLTLEKPFEIHDKATFFKTVYQQCRRPSLRNVASSSVRSLLTTGWDPNPSQRPTFEYIESVLASHIS